MLMSEYRIKKKSKKIMSRAQMAEVLKDKELQEAKAAESQKQFREKPFIGNLKPNVMLRKK